MSWLSSWFGKNKSLAAGRSSALSSTRDAFSMPSPMLSPSDAYEPESSASFTYPPQQSGAAYGYVPTGRRTSLLPMHNNNGNNGQYPPLAQTWRRLRTWLANEYPELGDTLNYAMLPQDMLDLEAQFGFALPQAVRESYAQADGQEPESSAACAEGLFFGLHLLPLEEVYDEWRFWRDVDNDPETGGHDRLRTAQQSVPPGWVRREYSNRGWIPLISDKAGNYIGVDLNPDEGGAAGQVIVFGRDFDTKVVLANGEGAGGWARWLAAFADMLESGDGFELQTGDGDSQGEEDDIGYQSYFGTGGEAAETRGPTGMALAGEYRGWPTLEAFADRGIRRWVEAGLVPDYTAQEKGKAPEDAQPGMLDLAQATTGDNGAAVAIPVYAPAPPTLERSESEDLQAPTPAPAPAADGPIPKINVTKPPAPRPVLLPTETDILAPTGSFDAPSPADVEGGFALPMAQRAGYAPPPSAAPAATPVPAPEAAPSAIFAEPAAAAPSASASAPLSDITDLLAESGPALETAALEPAPASASSGGASPVAATATTPDADLLAVDDAVSEGGTGSASELESEDAADLAAEGADGEAPAADDAKAKASP